MPAQVSPLLTRAVVAAIALLAAGCGSGGESPEGSIARGGVFDPGPMHVHGLGVNPKDNALFVATHTGLFRAAPGEKRSRRVGDRFQDTMGFTIIGPDRFLGSGHPDLREKLPPYLGLIRSGDGGRSWTSVSLLGDADFHVVEAQGRRLYGAGSDFESRNEQLLASQDGGRSWKERTLPEPLIGLAIRPGEPRSIIASGSKGLHASSDGGGSWRALSGGPGLPAWPAADRLYLLRMDGTLRVSTDAGRSWRDAGDAGDAGGDPAAFEAVSSTELYAALHDGTIKSSTDGGASWGVRARP